MANRHYIRINLFRVSLDSQYIDLLADCDTGYYFIQAQLEVRHPDHTGEFTSDWFELSDAILDPNTPSSKLSVRIPVSKLFLNEDVLPSIYILTLKVEDEDGEEEHSDSAICSDVREAFYYILDNILSLGNDCKSISEDAIRNYLILYGHQQALSNGEIDIAEEYFKVLIKNFSKCGNKSRACGTCGCGSHSKPISNCGCK